MAGTFGVGGGTFMGGGGSVADDSAAHLGRAGLTQVFSSQTGSKSAWQQLIAATTGTADELVIYGYGSNVVITSTIDIGVGGSGSETVVVADLLVQHTAGSTTTVATIRLPVPIPAGSRISARGQSASGSAPFFIGCEARLSGRPSGACVTYGATAPGGTAVDPGASTNTKGAWSELTAASSATARTAVVTIGNRANFARVSGSSWLVDIGVGGSGSETVVIADIPLWSLSTNSGVLPYWNGVFAFPVSSGSRIVARAACSTADATDRLIDVAVHAFA